MSCKSEFQLDDYAGNQVTVRCEHEKGHLGMHRRISTREGRTAGEAKSSSSGISISTTPRNRASTMKAVKVNDRERPIAPASRVTSV